MLRPEHPDPVAIGDLVVGLDVVIPSQTEPLAVTGVTARSGDAEPGDLFVALPGRAVHGAAHAVDAARRGAVAVLTDPAGAADAARAGLPVLVADDPRDLLGFVASRIYGTDARVPALYGVTGTNGKTSTVHLLAHLLERLGVPASISSTAERAVGGVHAPSRLTSPEADELHALLARAVEEGAGAAVVEVSAQALVRSRVNGVRFDVSAFTNLTHDHLDDFASMDDYLAAKARLFDRRRTRASVICVDSAPGRLLAAGLPDALTVTTRPDGDAHWRVLVDERSADGTSFTLLGPDGERIATRTALLGDHQVANAAVAVLIALTAGHDIEAVRAALGADGFALPLPGRLERVPGSVDPAVVVDVAHTPDALAAGIAALRPLTAGRLVILFGADGDRDASKRAVMGETASLGADVVIVHDHHSRTEDPARIRAMVLAGAAVGGAEVLEVRDPGDAIREAIRRAGVGGTVLWAGTGRTDYRDIDGVKRPYSFWSEAAAALDEHRRGAAVRRAPRRRIDGHGQPELRGDHGLHETRSH